MKHEKILGTCARTAVVAGLGLATVFGTVAPALAATGNVTITQSNNADATYDVYRLFKATVKTVGSEDKAQDITWDTDADKTAVLAFLADESLDGAYDAWLTANAATTGGISKKDVARNAAEFISYMITNDLTSGGVDTGANTTPPTTTSTSFATDLVQYLVKNGVVKDNPKGNPIKTGDTAELEQGYYFFATTMSTEGKEEAGTAPIWTAVTDIEKNILEKSAVPTVEKKVKEDSGDTYGITADANKDQALKFKITGTLPQNYGAFDKYHYKFTDNLPAGMSIVNGDDGVKVKMYESSADATADPDGAKDTVGVDVTKDFTIAYANDELTVDCSDLKSLERVINKDTVFVVYYEAKLDGDAVIGGTGNTNTAKLTYTNDPITNGDGDTNDKKTTTYTYQLDIEKVDKDSRAKLSGAKFTIQVAENEDAGSVGKYLQSDGSLGTTAYEFETNSEGKISVHRIDRGKYVVHETTAPSGYDTIDADVTIVIGTTLPTEAEAKVEEATATYSGGENYADDHQFKTVASGSKATAGQDGMYLVNENSDGVFAARVGDARIITLPGTGMTPSQAGTIAGAILLGSGLVMIIKRRREEATQA